MHAVSQPMSCARQTAEMEEKSNRISMSQNNPGGDYGKSTLY